MNQKNDAGMSHQLSSLRASLENAYDRRDEAQARLLSARIDQIQLSLWTQKTDGGRPSPVSPRPTQTR